MLPEHNFLLPPQPHGLNVVLPPPKFGLTKVLLNRNPRLFPDAATRPYCPEALFLFFSGKLSLPLCARLIAQHQEDQPEAVAEAKTSFHKAKEADSFTYHRPASEIHPQRFRERIRKRLRPRLRERIRQRFWKRSRQGQRQRQRKRKGPQITLARVTSLPTAMASHHRSWQRLRHIGAPACPGYRYHQPTPTTHSPLAAPPFRRTCLAPLPPLLDSIFNEPIWRLHHIGAPASLYLV